MDDADSHEHWPHAPPHWVLLPGTYFVTASTYQQQRIFDTPQKLTAVLQHLLDTARQFGWSLKAWALMVNHYHFLADSPEGTGASLRVWLKEFHRISAIRVNELAATSGRRVWMNFRETHITHQTLPFTVKLRESESGETSVGRQGDGLPLVQRGMV
jgi:putative transposase